MRHAEFITVLILLLCFTSCNSSRDRQLAGLIKLKEAKKGLQATGITIEGAHPKEEGTVVYFEFITEGQGLQKLPDSIWIAENEKGILHELP